MGLLKQRLSALDHFLLIILVASALSTSWAVAKDIQAFNQFYAASSADDHSTNDRFTISGSPTSHAMLPIRLLLMLSLLVSFIGIRSRKFLGRLLSTLTLLLLIGLYLQWWRHSFEMAKASQSIELIKQMSRTLYLKDANWLDIGVFFASISALGWMIATLIVQPKRTAFSLDR